MDPVMHRRRTMRLTPMLPVVQLVVLALLAAALLAGCRPVAAPQPMALVAQEDLPAELTEGDPILVTGLTNIQLTEDMTAPEDLTADAIALVIGPRSEFPAGLADSALALVDADAVAGMPAWDTSTTTSGFSIPVDVTGLSEFPASGLVYMPADLLPPVDTGNSLIDMRNGVPASVTNVIADGAVSEITATVETPTTMVNLWAINPSVAECVPGTPRCDFPWFCILMGTCDLAQPTADN